MVSDNPESFADLDGHCGQIIPGAPAATQPCGNPGANTHADEGEGNSGISFDENTGIADWYLAEVSAQSTQVAAQQAAQNTASSNSDKRTDVMLTPDSVPPKPARTEGAQFEMDYSITPQANTMQQVQENSGKLRDDKATQANYSNMEVKLWESQRGGKWQWQGDALKGHGHDVLNVFAQRADQRWYIDGKRVQLVIGKDSSGALIKAWTVHVEVKTTGPEFSKVD